MDDHDTWWQSAFMTMPNSRLEKMLESSRKLLTSGEGSATFIKTTIELLENELERRGQNDPTDLTNIR